MNDRNDSQSRPEAKSRRDRWVKLAFAGVVVVVVVLVWQLQRKRLQMKGWGEDIEAALTQARNEGRPVLVFFVKDPPSATARRMAKTTLARPENVRAIDQGRFVRVIVTVPSTTSDLAKRYKVTELPTMAILSTEGKPIKNHVGFIGEVPFRADFLPYKKTATSPQN